ncbi:WGR domain-containing protein [Sinimarinibacterium sp. CAU 1509]|uniref:WGR domain-containing protein n=1 Tax=Sinimarinibacterium sp. CAU 1509 TaxID=2562283 RepID=UPI0010AD04FA|nr:WGR domain-containing protein [Sinimarinibacterium sp. CAU 1509]TJY57186.1 WGR domain-containing protein [Sinimarinibacterium sp. CAU 1509]
MAAKTPLEGLTGPQALVAYELLKNTSTRSAFYELEVRQDVSGTFALYVRYGALVKHSLVGGGQVLVVARGRKFMCMEKFNDLITQKRGRGYVASQAFAPTPSLIDGEFFHELAEMAQLKAEAEREARLAVVRAEVSAQMSSPKATDALKRWDSDALFG